LRTELSTVIAYMLIPMLAVIAAGAVSSLWQPTAKLRSLIQHFAAGVVLAAVAGELLPEIVDNAYPLSVTLGFAVGVGVMVGVRKIGTRLERVRFGTAEVVALSLMVGIDIFIDGLLVGVAFLSGTQLGVLITIALTLEAFFLALAAAASFYDNRLSRRTTFLAAVVLAVVLGLGTLAGAGLFADAPEWLLAAVIAFAVAALLYLVVEELLVEAHEVPETTTATVMFFVGFFCMVMLDTVYERL